MKNKIDKKDLRIGNKVLIGTTVSFGVLEYKYSEHILTANDLLHIEMWGATEKYKPIPLTPERLLEYGFIHNQKHCSYSLNGFIIIQWEDGGFILSKYEVYKENEKPQMELFYYLHELQNIIYDLTKKELEKK